MSGDWAIESAGRWRVAGDTLWLLTAPEYGQWAGLQSSLGRSVTDTVGAGRLPKHDPLFWSKVSPAMVHKVTLTGNQLSLFSFDSLAKNPQAPAHGVYTRVDTDSANGRHP